MSHFHKQTIFFVFAENLSGILTSCLHGNDAGPTQTWWQSRYECEKDEGVGQEQPLRYAVLPSLLCQALGGR